MGILSALNKSVGGLAAQSFALENIAGNIANSQTTAYKRLDTSFQDLVQSSSLQVSYQTSGNVQAKSRSTNGLQGGISSASSGTYMAVKGDGYFVVQARSGTIDNRAILSGANVYTRTGDFDLDREGYLVNGSGYHLMGYQLDPSTGNPVGSVLEPIRVSNSIMPADMSTEISYELNLPTHPVTQNSLPTDPSSELWSPPSGWAEGDGLTGADDTNFVANSISGRSVTLYDSKGSPVNVQFRWAKVAPVTTDNADTTSSWQLFYLADSAAEAADPMWTSVGRYDFDGAGRMLGAYAGGAYSTDTETVPMNQLTVNGVNVGDITMRHDNNGVSQQDDPSGAAYVGALSQNGLPPGNFINVSIADGGRVVANYTNGKTVGLYEIPLVSFSAPGQLTRLDGGAYAETVSSGAPTFGTTGQIVGSSLEGSNVDIGEEFSKLIVTQQAFTANSRVITAADEMLTEVVNVVR